MLESARRQGASIFVYLIFCLLIAIFVINFGPQKNQGDSGCRGASNVIVSVDGQEATQSSYHIAYANGYNRGNGKEKTYLALEYIIRREILAQEAESRGLRVDDSLIQEQIKKGYFYIGGQRTMIPSIFDENHIWNLRAFKSWYGSMNVSRNSYVGEQGRGLLASMMADMLKDSIQVSREEALTHYLYENNTVQYDVVNFKADAYKAALKLTDADVDRFLAAHTAEVEARYKADERTYKAVKPQLQLRQIFIAKLDEPKPEPPAPAPGAGTGSAAGAGSGSAAGAGSGSAAGPGSAAEPKKDDKKDDKKVDPKAEAKKDDKAKPDEKAVGMPIGEAKKKLEEARASIAANKAKFEDVAKTLNTDESAKASGGDIGWHTADNPSLPDKAVSDAVKTLKAGDMTPVIETPKGAYLVMAVAKREGDLSFDQVKHELAVELAKDVWSKEAAKRAALAALEKARGGTGLNLDQIYKKEEAPSGPSPGGIDIEQILNDPNMTQEQKDKVLKMLMQQQGQKSGQIVYESRDIPAAWYADDNGGTGGSSTTTPAKGSAAASPATGTPTVGSAAPPVKDVPKVGSAAPATPPIPKVGSAAPPHVTGAAAGSAATGSGSAATGSGAAGTVAGAGTGSAGTTSATGTVAPATPAPEVVATTKLLPAFGEVTAPTVARFGPSPRSASMSGLGTSKDAIGAVFDELSAGMLAKHVYEADGGFILVQVIAHTQPKVDDFEKDADRLVSELREQRGQAFLGDWLKDRCEKLAKDGRIKPNAALIREFDDAGRPLPVSYRPCMYFKQQ